MNSGNHVMLLGDLLTWCYQYLGGIRQSASDMESSTFNTATAYKHIVLKPAFDIQDCFDVDASYESPYGRISSCWKKSLQKLHWEVTIPVNTTATVCLPNGEQKEIGSGNSVFDVAIPTKNAAILKDEFLYDFTSFPEAHASTIVELKNGDLLASYFGGTKERNPDVCIWVSRKSHKSNQWEAPRLVGDGVFALGAEDAKFAGLPGINDSTTSAANGPVLNLPKHRYSYLTRTSGDVSAVVPTQWKRKA